MKQFLFIFALIGCIFTANAQKKADTLSVSNANIQQTEQIKSIPSPSTGDYFDGLTRPLTFNRMIPPYVLEVTFSKTVHIIFPSAIRYVDLGSADLLAAKADGAENVLRVKSALRDFSKESNLAVITEDGAYYTFNVKYADEPVKLSVEMTDFIHDGEAVNRPNNAMEIYMRELGSESPLLVKLIMKSIYKNNKREIKHIGSKRLVFSTHSKVFIRTMDCFIFICSSKIRQTYPLTWIISRSRSLIRKLSNGQRFRNR